MKTFKVSRRQIQRIKTEDPSLVKTVKKRPGKFTDEMKIELLHQLEQKSSTTLTELARFIKEKIDVTVSTQAISNLIHDMDITWKQTTNIPNSWNKPQLIELQPNFVHHWILSKLLCLMRQALIFTLLLVMNLKVMV